MKDFKFGDIVRHPDFKTECVFIRQLYDIETGEKTWAEIFNEQECDGRTIFVANEPLELKPVGGWISVKDSLPAFDETVLLIDEWRNIRSGYLDGDAEAFVYTDDECYLDDDYITHWCYLPELPKGE